MLRLATDLPATRAGPNGKFKLIAVWMSAYIDWAADALVKTCPHGHGRPASKHLA